MKEPFLLLLVRPLARRDERGDVPGWVLVTVMTAGLVMAIWGLADVASQPDSSANTGGIASLYITVVVVYAQTVTQMFPCPGCMMMLTWLSTRRTVFIVGVFDSRCRTGSKLSRSAC